MIVIKILTSIVNVSLFSMHIIFFPMWGFSAYPFLLVTDCLDVLILFCTSLLSLPPLFHWPLYFHLSNSCSFAPSPDFFFHFSSIYNDLCLNFTWKHRIDILLEFPFISIFLAAFSVYCPFLLSFSCNTSVFLPLFLCHAMYLSQSFLQQAHGSSGITSTLVLCTCHFLSTSQLRIWQIPI